MLTRCLGKGIATIRLAVAGAVVAAGLLLFTSEPALADCYGSVYVDGYYRSNGTYVQGYYRTCPDSNPYNNYGYPGNYNPNTGRTSPGSAWSYLDSYYGSGYGWGYGSAYSNPYGSYYGSRYSYWP